MKALKHRFITSIVLLSLVMGFASAGINAQEQSTIPNRQPIILLQETTRGGHEGREHTVWKLGSINPTFVLYNDGLVIFKKDKNQFELFSVELTPDKLSALLEELAIGEEFLQLEDSYYTNNQFHQPLYIIKYWQDEKPKRVMVAGPIRDSEEDRDKAPKAFLEIFDKVMLFARTDAHLWKPEKVEIRVSPYTDSEGQPVPWPRGWPDLKHKTTKDRRNFFGHEAYHMYIAGENKDELEQILSGLKEKQAVLINERQWYISPTRYCLPSEELWINN